MDMEDHWPCLHLALLYIINKMMTRLAQRSVGLFPVAEKQDDEHAKLASLPTLYIHDDSSYPKSHPFPILVLPEASSSSNLSHSASFFLDRILPISKSKWDV